MKWNELIKVIVLTIASMLAVEAAKKYFPDSNVVVTGNPVRPQNFFLSFLFKDIF